MILPPVPMDNASARVIEFKLADPDQPTVAIKEKDGRQCNHGSFKVDDKNRTVECGHCQRKLDAMHVLVLIAYSEQRRRWMKEQAEQFDRKQSEKTIKGAVIALGKRGIDPERFAALLAKYQAGPVGTV